MPLRVFFMHHVDDRYGPLRTVTHRYNRYKPLQSLHLSGS